jgi:hypothetical protein
LVFLGCMATTIIIDAGTGGECVLLRITGAAV